MQGIKRILVPVDFTEFSQRAADYAAMLARRFRASVRLVHAVEPFTYDVTDTVQVINHYQALITIADRLMKNLRDRIGKRGVAVTSVILKGSPALQVVAEAKRRRVDLIVMGTHGRTGLEHLVLGSVAERVVRLAPCPVLTVGHPRRSRARKGKPLPLIGV
ncbi:MAG: universal stress protein [Nitrospirota bacterium]